MSYELVVISGADEGQRFDVTDGEVLIGRSGDAAVSLKDESVAFEHAIVRVEDGKLYIQNLSALGTIVRGRKVTEEMQLAANDEIELSRSCRLVVEQSDAAGGSGKGLLIGAVAVIALLLVVGFAAETQDVVAHATDKRARKGCDWIVANDVSPETGIMGGSENAVTLITAHGSEAWPRMSKEDTARKLAARIAEALA